jgi:hypothetical protein
MLALAYLAVTRPRLAAADPPAEDQMTVSANEIRRMFTALCSPPPDQDHARRWSRWRHQHQQRACHCHYKRQHQQDH